MTAKDNTVDLVVSGLASLAPVIVFHSAKAESVVRVMG